MYVFAVSKHVLLILLQINNSQIFFLEEKY